MTSRPLVWLGKGLVRIMLLVIAAAAVAALALTFGIARDYRYLRASLLTGTPGGKYHMLGTGLAARAQRGQGTLSVVPTAGSVENVRRLIADQQSCTETFGFVQDGTPVPRDAQLETLGRLPEPEALLLLGQRNRSFSTFSDLRGASIGIGPEGSGTAYLMRELFEDPDLKGLGVHLLPHELAEQTELVAQGRLDLAAIVMAEDAEFIQTAIRKYALDIASPRDLQGLVMRHPWLSLGRIPAGRYDLVDPTPPIDKVVAQVDTFIVASPCDQRADRMALLMLLSAELPGFARGNPPKSTGSATKLPLAAEARQFFLTGEPEIADRYFPWLVNLLPPPYWVYLLMAATVLGSAFKGYSRFRLWRIDAAREQLEARLEQLTGPGHTSKSPRAGAPELVLMEAEARATAQDILNDLVALRERCRRQTGSFVTPMGEEMFYRYQESLIDNTATMLRALLQRSQPASRAPRKTGDATGAAG